MTTLQRRALARLPLPAADVERLYAVRDIAHYPRGSAIDAVRTLAESHERLRAELAGSAVLHAESAAALRDAAGRLALAAALTDTGSPAFRAAFPAHFGPDGVYLGGVPGWRVIEAVRAALLGEG